MIVDIGGGVCEVAVISLGGIVVSKSIKIGGDSFDEAIVRYVNDAYGLMIGERTAEGIKKKIGEVYEHKEAKIVEVKGRDIVTGMPKVINLSSKEMIGATFEPMTMLIDCICEIIEKTPPELVGDILHNGIMLVGGGAKLSGLDKLIHRVTGIKTYVADDPEDCVVKGAAAKLESINKYSIEG
jgi:rod shape-determining protein MreB